jgi:hypothetical protein
MITFKHRGDFKHTDKLFAYLKSGAYFRMLERYGDLGVEALRNSTPKDSGETANAWSYSIRHSGSRHYITWSNSHVHDGVHVACYPDSVRSRYTWGHIRAGT